MLFFCNCWGSGSGNWSSLLQPELTLQHKSSWDPVFIFFILLLFCWELQRKCGEGGRCWAIPILIFSYSMLTWKLFYPHTESFAASFSVNSDSLTLATIMYWVSTDARKSHPSQDSLCAGACRADTCIPRWRTGNISLGHSLHQWYTPGGKIKCDLPKFRPWNTSSSSLITFLIWESRQKGVFLLGLLWQSSASPWLF